MDINCIIAMTAAQIAHAPSLPQPIAWMACHFSRKENGLTDLPAHLPKGASLLVDDSIPINGHDPSRIAEQLTELTEKFSVDAVILDLQRPMMEENRVLATFLAEKLPCTVCVSAMYAETLTCPVLLPPPPPHIPLRAHLAPWKGRQIWLEALLEAEEITVTAQGSNPRQIPLPRSQELPFADWDALCRYRFSIQEDRVVFTLARDRQMLRELLHQGSRLGVARAVGLYAQLQESPEVL